MPSPWGKVECGPRHTSGFFLEAGTLLLPSFMILVWPCKQQDLGGAALEKGTESKIWFVQKVLWNETKFSEPPSPYLQNKEVQLDDLFRLLLAQISINLAQVVMKWELSSGLRQRCRRSWSTLGFPFLLRRLGWLQLTLPNPSLRILHRIPVGLVIRVPCLTGSECPPGAPQGGLEELLCRNGVENTHRHHHPHY